MSIEWVICVEMRKCVMIAKCDESCGEWQVHNECVSDVCGNDNCVTIAECDEWCGEWQVHNECVMCVKCVQVRFL